MQEITLKTSASPDDLAVPTKEQEKVELKQIDRANKTRDQRIEQEKIKAQGLGQMFYGVGQMAQAVGQGATGLATMDMQIKQGEDKYQETLAEGEKQATQALYGMLDGVVNKILSRFDQLASMTVETAGTFRAALAA